MITLKKWQLALALTLPFLGIIKPAIYVIILITYFLFWGYVLMIKDDKKKDE